MNSLVFNKTFNLDSPLIFPNHITSHQVEDKFIFIDPEFPTYIVVSHLGAEVVNLLLKGYTLRETLNLFYQRTDISENESLNLIKSVLIEMDLKKLLTEGRSIIEEEEITPVLQLHLTNSCNLNCRHCYMESGFKLKDELRPDSWMSIIKEYSGLYQSNRTICFTGGEPLLNLDFFNLASAAKNLNNKTFLFTNGTLINSQKIINELEKVIDHIQLSLDGATEKVHDAIRGKGSFKKVLTALKLLSGSNIEINLAITIMPLNETDIRDNIISLLNTLNIPNLGIVIGSSNAEGRAINSKYIYYNDDNGHEIIYDILDKLYKTIWHPNIAFPPGKKIKNCGYGETIVISADGHISACTMNSRIGQFNLNSISEIINIINQTNDVLNPHNIEICRICDLKFFCAGGCKIKNYKSNGKMEIPDCNKTYKNKFYKRLVKVNWSSYQIINERS